MFIMAQIIYSKDFIVISMGNFFRIQNNWLAKFLLLRLETLTLVCHPLKDEQHALKTISHSGQIVELQHNLMHRG